MKKVIFYIGFVLAVALTACEDDSLSSGASVLPDSDGIVVNVDTFSMGSALRMADYIYSSPDSFLLGECDNRFGTIHADILAQFACPVSFVLPENAAVDSICVYLYYNTWFGDGNTPLQLSIYQMDKGTFRYSSPYPNNLNLADYCTLDPATHILDRDRIITAASPTDSLYSSSTESYIPYIRFKTTDAFAQSFFENADFSSQDKFNEQFKGLYITSSFGSATVLHVAQMTMTMFYHFSYEKNGKDTVVNDTKAFYANKEVRQVNRIEYSNSRIDEIEPIADSVNFIVSPANVYTRLSIPMAEMSTHIKAELGNRRPYVNQAKIAVEVLNVYTGATDDKTVEDWAQPANNMLLIKESALSRFFDKRELPTDTCAILATLTAGVDTLGNLTYSYEYDLSTLLTQQLREEQAVDTLQMVLVPVTLETSSSSTGGYYGSTSTSISSVRQQQTISATTIRSAQNKDNPMRLDVIYCGF